MLFFDECESMFAQRGHGGSSQMSMMLTEIEKHTGIIFLATNRPFDLDEAMHRRITASFEFRPPNHIERAAIWRIHTAEAGVPMRDDVDWKEIAVRYELAGGYADLRPPSVLRPNPAICMLDENHTCSMKEGCV